MKSELIQILCTDTRAFSYVLLDVWNISWIFSHNQWANFGYYSLYLDVSSRTFIHSNIRSHFRSINLFFWTCSFLGLFYDPIFAILTCVYLCEVSCEQQFIEWLLVVRYVCICMYVCCSLLDYAQTTTPFFFLTKIKWKMIIN